MKITIKIFAISIAMVFAFTNCQNDKEDLKKVELLSDNSMVAAAASTDCEHVHFSYTGEEGPDHWKDLCPGWADCGGTSQSPINISWAYVNKRLKPLKFKYNETATNIVNNGHTIKFDCDNGSSLYVGRKKYDLIQFHYHGLSEHQVSGQHYPLEVHFVHAATDGNLAVVGIFFEEGDENELFEDYLEHFPHHEGEYSSTDMIELDELLPESPNYYTYSGSLTTPPCSEIVTWFVMEEPIEASAEQIHEFSEILHDNYRPVQPLNGRNVYAFRRCNNDD